jgi:uncharacterized protein YegL
MFVLDTSGSMTGTPLQILKNAVNKIVQDPSLSTNSKFGYSFSNISFLKDETMT